MSANPHANCGILLRDLVLPDFRTYGVEVTRPGASLSEAKKELGTFLRDVIQENPDNFRLVGPDETSSNRLQAVFEATDKVWLEPLTALDENLGPDGRVMEVLSEHMCQGWLEGYLLTGRHGLFSCYEAFIHIVDSMVNQHPKWLKVTNDIPWRRPIAALYYLLTPHVWRQDPHGFPPHTPASTPLRTTPSPPTHPPPRAPTPKGVPGSTLPTRSLTPPPPAPRAPPLTSVRVRSSA